MSRPSAITRGSAGRYVSPVGIRMNNLTKGDAMANRVIAKEDLVVHDDALGIDRKIFAGDPVPPDLVTAYNSATGGSPVGDDATDWSSKSKEELEAAVEQRGLTVEGTGKDGNVVKDDLVAALEASD